MASNRRRLNTAETKQRTSLFWRRRFEAFVSTSGCLGYLLINIELAVGSAAKDTLYFPSQGLSPSHTKNARISWMCFTENMMTGTNLLDRVFARQSTSGAWEVLRDWFLPISIDTQTKWSDDVYVVQREKVRRAHAVRRSCRQDVWYSCFARCAEIAPKPRR